MMEMTQAWKTNVNDRMFGQKLRGRAVDIPGIDLNEAVQGVPIRVIWGRAVVPATFISPVWGMRAIEHKEKTRGKK